MDISEIADIADIMAAIGVIASLLFIAFQVRQNTKATELDISHVKALITDAKPPIKKGIPFNATGLNVSTVGLANATSVGSTK